MERLRELIAEEQPAKRPRQREARPYEEYSLQEFLRQESWLWERRRLALSDTPARLPAELPRGDRAGPDDEPAPPAALHDLRPGAAGRADAPAADETLPPRGAHGWRNHWRHGLLGAVRYWAAGSKFKVAFMLAELADEFGVKDEARRRHPA